MRNWYRTILTILGIASLSVALVACGSGGTTGSSGQRYCIATDFPTSGADGSEGLPAENGVTLAVAQNKDLGNGNTLDVIHFNDVSAALGKHDPTTGAQNVTQMLQNKCIVAMVGPFNSGVAAAEMPIAAKGYLAMISPANTNPGLTLQQYAQPNGFNFDTLHPSGFPLSYFRIPANDVTQGHLDADYTFDTLGAKKVYIVDDEEPYGVGLADNFKDEFTSKGGTVLGRDGITSTDTAKLPTLASTIAATHPDAVFYGGVTSNGGGLLKAQLVSHGLTNTFMVGGDGIAGDSQFLKDAGGTAANNTVGTVAAPDSSTFTSGASAKFVSDYKAMFNSDVGPYSANSYDAAQIEIKAIKNLLAAGKPVTRQNMETEIAGIQYTGVTGNLSFDKNGDNAGQKVFSIYQVTNGQWVFVKEVQV